MKNLTLINNILADLHISNSVLRKSTGKYGVKGTRAHDNKELWKTVDSLIGSIAFAHRVHKRFSDAGIVPKFRIDDIVQELYDPTNYKVIGIDMVYDIFLYQLEPKTDVLEIHLVKENRLSKIGVSDDVKFNLIDGNKMNSLDAMRLFELIEKHVSKLIVPDEHELKFDKTTCTWFNGFALDGLSVDLALIKENTSRSDQIHIELRVLFKKNSDDEFNAILWLNHGYPLYLKNVDLFKCAEERYVYEKTFGEVLNKSVQILNHKINKVVFENKVIPCKKFNQKS